MILESSLMPLSNQVHPSPPEATTVDFYPHSNMDLDLMDLRSVTLVLGDLGKSAWESHQQVRCLYSLSSEKGPAWLPSAWLCCPQYAT